MPLRKCVSFGNHGSSAPVTNNGETTIGTPWSSDVDGVVTTDGYTPGSCIAISGTGWVRIFVEWSYFAPNGPTPPANPATEPWGYPVVRGSYNQAQVTACYQVLNRNIKNARANGAKVILTTTFFPKWVNGVAPASTSETIILGSNSVVPPNDALIYPASSAPPSGNASFAETDYAYYYWIANLINLYHPSNPSRPSVAGGQYVDVLEMCNEPNRYYPAGDTSLSIVPGGAASLATSTAVMMTTTQKVNADFNVAFAEDYENEGKSPFVPLYAFGPALADSNTVTVTTVATTSSPAAALTWQTFAALILAYLKETGFDFADPLFGWSHHNYADIEAIGRDYAPVAAVAYQTGAVNDAELADNAGFDDVLAPQFVPAYFGTDAVQLRTLLTANGWTGYSDSGESPSVFMTEGGCQISKMPPLTNPSSLGTSVNPNANYSTGAVPAAFQRELQRVSVAGAAYVLQMRTPEFGLGVGLLTNFLFFDAAYSSGLLDEYGPQQPTKQANVALDTYARPVFGAWSDFGFSTACLLRNGLPARGGPSQISIAKELCEATGLLP